ncbi:MAG: FKBP-type peptidyl-prolyl cis-trans isomerase [Candidatus Obscuribacterales bacterium]|jgi:peptidylprolyl isomerase|nr:FKBP-type peptidyl-prolyl cis-trans isomerase [Candidatus Obscuribacterales bacterium]
MKKTILCAFASLGIFASLAIGFPPSANCDTPAWPIAANQKVVKTPSGLQYFDMEPGKGPTPTAGSTVFVHYTGWLMDKKKFDSSVDRNEPFSFTLGAGQVIKGWDEGVATMRVGGKRRLVIPASLGYGARGAAGAIPPNATLVFDVQLLKFQ